MIVKDTDVLIGMQYGSEGKGVIAQHLAKDYANIGCCNSSQAGHTIYVDGIKRVNRQLPSGWCNLDARLFIGAGSMINPTVLKEEVDGLEAAGYHIKNRLFIDRNAGLVLPWHQDKEQQIFKDGQSTKEGVGAAWQDRVVRNAPVASELHFFKSEGYNVVNVSDMLAKAKGGILLEGCQGFGLSLFHGDYPHVTSRDTTPGTLMAGMGINPHRLNEVYGVMRTYPIRIHGESGPMGKEISWEEVTKRCKSDKPICEMTTVTKKVRRVAKIDWEMLKRSARICGVTNIALTFLNYIDSTDYGKNNYLFLSDKGKKFIWKTINKLNIPVSIVNTSPMPEHNFRLPSLGALYATKSDVTDENGRKFLCDNKGD